MTIHGQRKPKIAIGFFGVTRSLAFTLPSIAENVVGPARELGDARVFAHLYKQDRIVNERSGENNAVDAEEYRLLGCDELVLEEPGHCLDGARYEWILSHGDAFNDHGKSLSNLIHQLHSLHVLGTMIGRWNPDIVLLVRPDLRYHDSFASAIRSHIDRPSTILTLPNWQWYSGYNDRFAVCNPQGCRLYTTRIEMIPQYLRQKKNPLHSEELLKFCLMENRIEPKRMSVRGSRVRSNGQMVAENFKPVSTSKKMKRKLELLLCKILPRNRTGQDHAS